MTILLSPRPGPSPRCTFQSHFPRTNVGKLSLECLPVESEGVETMHFGSFLQSFLPLFSCSKRDRQDITAFSPSSRHRPLWPCGRTRLKKEEEEEGDPRLEEEEEELTDGADTEERKEGGRSWTTDFALPPIGKNCCFYYCTSLGRPTHPPYFTRGLGGGGVIAGGKRDNGSSNSGSSTSYSLPSLPTAKRGRRGNREEGEKRDFPCFLPGTRIRPPSPHLASFLLSL